MWRKRLSSTLYIILLALFFTLVENIALWQHVNALIAKENVKVSFLITLPIFIFSTMFALFSLLIWPYIYRVVALVLILSSSMAAFSMFNYGNEFDYGMIASVMETNTEEAFSYLSFASVTWLIVVGVIPSILFCYCLTPKFHASVWRITVMKILQIISALLIVALIAVFQYKDYVSFIRNHSELKSLLNPTDFLTATYRYEKDQLVDSHIPYTPQGLDAVNNNSGPANILVLVLGETSRSMNYSLNGYAKLTNPKLATRNVISFKKVASCGTYTALSVPCMFSNMTRDNYSEAMAYHQDGLMDILGHAKIDVSWRDNDGGCKGVCDRIPTAKMTKKIAPQLCKLGSCYDDILLKGLADKIQNAQTDTVIGLHLIGSHGPSYTHRYPAEFETFKPVCSTSDLQACSIEQITNAYDNTIVYTDHILSQVIDTLNANASGNNVALFYVSDHGESLGENGVYLHGLPYRFAPIEQKSVPMIVWLSEKFEQHNQLDIQSLRNKANSDHYSHDNFFHSILGLMRVSTKLYLAELDLFHPCRKKP